jgi:hypothetical protein
MKKLHPCHSARPRIKNVHFGERLYPYRCFCEVQKRLAGKWAILVWCAPADAEYQFALRWAVRRSRRLVLPTVTAKSSGREFGLLAFGLPTLDRTPLRMRAGYIGQIGGYVVAR